MLLVRFLATGWREYAPRNSICIMIIAVIQTITDLEELAERRDEFNTSAIVVVIIPTSTGVASELEGGDE